MDSPFKNSITLPPNDSARQKTLLQTPIFPTLTIRQGTRA
jgi:hypothetical protein